MATESAARIREPEMRRPVSTRERIRNYADRSKVFSQQTVISVGSIDYTAMLVICLLVLIGVIMIFTSGIYIAENTYNNMFYFLKRQSIFAVMGFCVMVLVSNFNYRYYIALAAPLFIVSSVLLVAVQLIGKTVYGATRWINLPIIGQFQPSELAKVSIIFLVAFLVQRNKSIIKTWSGFFILCGLIGLNTALVLLGGLSSAIIVAVIGFGMLFVASPYIWRFLFLGGLGAVGVAGIIMIPSEFREDRVAAWLDPFAHLLGVGYQIVQSLFAIASGGLFGLGIGQSRQRSFLPLAHNDFIFAIICEELGFVGAALVLVLFGMLIWRGINIAIKAPDIFGSLIATGIVLMLGSQVIINVAVVTNSIPNTGVTMPFISYGGTSFLISMFLMGVLLNISRYSKKN